MSGALLNENLPESLVGVLSELGIGAKHVSQAGLLGRSDKDVWQHALAERLAIVTKDGDYVDLAQSTGIGRVLHLAVGNLRSRDLGDFIRRHVEAVSDFLRGKDSILVLKR